MTYAQRQAAVTVAVILLIGGCVWGWFALFEKKWESHLETSDAARENRMLAATRLLTRHKYSVKNEITLGSALHKSLPNGTLIFMGYGGNMTTEQGKQLLEWIRRGNTLITRPKWRSDPTNKKTKVEPVTSTREKRRGDLDDDQNKNRSTTETDPIGTYLGVVLTARPTTSATRNAAKAASTSETETEAGAETKTETAKKIKSEPPLASITLPGSSYALQIDGNSSTILFEVDNARTPLFSDDNAEAVRVYTEGTGHIVLLANHYFNNDSLDAYDHAELLLGLSALNGKAKNFLIVQRVDVLTWYQALWLNFQFTIISIVFGLLLLFWAAVRRFGPLLPEPTHERRSLIEHIDASGRWLWKVPGGRELLLAATRKLTTDSLQRRAPHLHNLSLPDQIDHLAQHSNLPAADLTDALHQPAARLPIDFTRQIHTLQQLRTHYER